MYYLEVIFLLCGVPTRVIVSVSNVIRHSVSSRQPGQPQRCPTNIPSCTYSSDKTKVQ